MTGIQENHWPTTIEEARCVQQQHRNQVIRDNDLGEVHHVAGVDVGFEDKGKTTRAAVAVLRFPELVLVEKSVIRQATCFPYIPGYLSFRELPAVLAALKKLKISPDLVLCDGQGIAHPRRFGLACHLGVITGLPSIGVAKSRLIGKHAEPAATKGAWVPLTDKGETIGAVLRSRDNVRPLYISTGHHVDLPTAIDYVLRCTTHFRLPETTRWAHKLASG
jgi:deoxyribonuclease V